MKYIMTIQYGSMDEVMYQDIIKRPDVSLFYVSGPMHSNVLYKIRRVHTSMPATKYFEPILKTVWYEKKLLQMADHDVCIIFQAATMLHIGLKTLRNIRKKRPNAKLVLFLLDSVHAHSTTMIYAKKYIFGFDWDLIFSFDKSDCEEFGFIHMGYSYYSKIELNCNSGRKSDLYYIGALKKENSRTKQLKAVYKLCRKNNVECDFKFLSPQEEHELSAQGIKILNKPLHYTEVLQDICSSKCILELVQPGQLSQTARYMEAVCYNKKLLTNNEKIETLPYYNPEYMKCFKSLRDIDTEWIKDGEEPDYKYQGDFSPLRLIEIMEETWK